MKLRNYGMGLLILGTLVAGLSGASAEEMRKVRLGSDGVYPPWNYKDAGGAQTGYEVELANDLCQRVKVTCEWTFQAFDGLIPALNEDRFDVLMASLGITASREKAIDFSIQYYAGPHLFVASTEADFAKTQAKGNGVKLRMEKLEGDNQATYDGLKAALKGKTVGVERGVKYVDFLKQWFPDVTVRQYDKSEAIYLDLQADRIDAAFEGYSSVHAFLQRQKAAGGTGEQFQPFGPEFWAEALGRGVAMGFAKGKNEDLRKAFNTAIYEATEDGTISKLSLKWMEYDGAVHQATKPE